MDLNIISKTLDHTGLFLRGGFYPTEEDAVPNVVTGQSTVVMIGNAGSDIWPVFEDAYPADKRSETANLLDDWTRKVISGVANEVNAVALYTFEGPPYHPFQRWAKRAEGLHASPIGPLIHPEYGLWHAYRAALVFDRVIPLPELAVFASPCDSCTDKPCLTSCPAHAFDRGSYDVPACTGYLEANPLGDCMSASCRARRACPVGQKHTYATEHARFHMQKFLLANR